MDEQISAVVEQIAALKRQTKEYQAKIAELQRAMRVRTPEQIAASKARARERARQYYETNRARIAERCHNYVIRNRDTCNEKHRAYYAANRERILAAGRIRHAKKMAPKKLAMAQQKLEKMRAKFDRAYSRALATLTPATTPPAIEVAVNNVPEQIG